jgi:hypothetical protein
MVKTHVDIIPLDIVSYFKNNMNERMKKDFKVTYVSDDNPVVLEHRVALGNDDPAYKKLCEFVYKIIPQGIYFYAAYQRQFHPHDLHADLVTPDTNLEWAYSMVIPLDQNINGIFKTLVWKQELERNSQTFELINLYRNSQDQYPKKFNNSELYDLDHLAYADSIIDSIELDGVYEYQLGSIGQFTRSNMHCSSNWKKHNLTEYKDLIIIHAG